MSIVHFRRIERRRTARVALCVDLIVHGENEGNAPFKTEARTLSVSKYGGMMVLEPEVAVGQKLMLVNMNSAQKVECQVVSAKLTRDGKRNVAFEFTSGEINFWKMCFPAAGTKPTRRAAQSAFGALPATKMAH
jgi:c-di-GMP-binding flagellar brake protein YcgR